MKEALLELELKGVEKVKQGKVRDIFGFPIGKKDTKSKVTNYWLIVSTDRVSAFDVIMLNGVPERGKILNKISNFWFGKISNEWGLVANHLVFPNLSDFPLLDAESKVILDGRASMVRKVKPFPVECIVRGYITGSGWKNYKKDGTVCGIELPKGLRESDKLPEPIFTPSTKAEEGHDVNISFDTMQQTIQEWGFNNATVTDTRFTYATKLKNLSLEIYKRASDYAKERGIIIADTKFEFGYDEQLKDIVLIDEVLTPDSSRFWSVEKYEPGRSQDSFDKQLIRDYLESIGYDKKTPVELPREIIQKTADRYEEISGILMENNK